MKCKSTLISIACALVGFQISDAGAADACGAFALYPLTSYAGEVVHGRENFLDITITEVTNKISLNSEYQSQQLTQYYHGIADADPSNPASRLIVESPLRPILSTKISAKDGYQRFDRFQSGYGKSFAFSAHENVMYVYDYNTTTGKYDKLNGKVPLTCSGNFVFSGFGVGGLTDGRLFAVTFQKNYRVISY